MDSTGGSALLLLIESILEDGEVSPDELYGLAEWLNENPEQCDRWPGDILANALAKAWADGSISPRELKQLANLLLKVVKESRKRDKAESLREVSVVVSKAIEGIDLWCPVIPSIPVTVAIESESEKGRFYEVDLTGPSCTCPDWSEERRHLPQGQMGRCCKHVMRALSAVRPENGWPGWLAAFVGNAYPPKPSQTWGAFDLVGKPCLISSPHKGWVNVLSPCSDGYSRFGYSVEERRWAYGERPYRSTQILEEYLPRML